MIPKIIHYCWFGHNPLPPLMIKCINSWKKKCPDYKIIQWNESNYDINSILYTKEAYNEKKYAFVSDYARFEILYNYGGIYLDTDVELVKNLDNLLNNKSFMGFETDVDVAPGLIIGCEQKSKIIKELKDCYISKSFYNQDGTLNLTTVVKYTTNILLSHGLQLNGNLQYLDDIVIYPKEYFNPTVIRFGKHVIYNNTYSIHHYAGTWLSLKQQKKKNKIKLIQSIIGSRNLSKLVNLKHLLFREKK